MDIEKYTSEELCVLTQRIEHEQNQRDAKAIPALKETLKRLLRSGKITRKELLIEATGPAKPKLPVKYYDENTKNFWSGKGQKKSPFDKTEKKDMIAYLIPDEIAPTVALHAKRDVLTKTQQLVKYVDTNPNRSA